MELMTHNTKDHNRVVVVFLQSAALISKLEVGKLACNLSKKV